MLSFLNNIQKIVPTLCDSKVHALHMLPLYLWKCPILDFHLINAFRKIGRLKDIDLKENCMNVDFYIQTLDISLNFISFNMKVKG